MANPVRDAWNEVLRCEALYDAARDVWSEARAAEHPIKVGSIVLSGSGKKRMKVTSIHFAKVSYGDRQHLGEAKMRGVAWKKTTGDWSTVEQKMWNHDHWKLEE